MKKFAQIINNKLHWKFQQEQAPQFAPDIQIVEITNVSPEPQEGWDWNGTAFIPPPVPDPILIKTLKWEVIKRERDRRIQNGGYKVGTKWFHSDTFSRTQQMGLMMMGANIPANTPWKTMDGSTVVMTQTLAGQIFGTAAASDIAIFAAAETHKAAMEASADPASYDFSTGWPKAYGE